MEDLLNVLETKEVKGDLILTDVGEEVATTYVPLVRKTVTYIVSGLLFNEQDEVLLMQEAKSSCYGLWYLPAGRMEPDETIEDAVKREVLEETGLHCIPEYFLSIELTFHQWFRFNMVCSISGGSLKTVSDGESLQAKWFSVNTVLGQNVKLRSKDIIPVIEEAYRRRKIPDNFIRIRPINTSHHHLLMRTVFIYYSKDKSEYSVLFGRRPRLHLPTFRSDNGLTAYALCVKKIFGTDQLNPIPRSVLTIEHCGKPKHRNDGFCLTILAPFSTDERPKITNTKNFEWCNITSEIILKLLHKASAECEGPSVTFL